MTAGLAALLLALVLDWRFGEPETLWKRVPHPVVLAGNLIGWLDGALNRDGDSRSVRMRQGVVCLAVMLVVALGSGWLLVVLFSLFGPLAWVGEGLVAFTLIAQKSMRDHVKMVAGALRNEGLEAGRRQVSQIVGRDPSALDESGVARASIESLAENYSDGVVAPAFWFAVAGLPGLFAYKMVNTADSMIGHRSEKYEHFGKAAAIADDVANWLPARLSVLLVAAGGWLASGHEAAARSIATALRDAGLHRSPNAGWPEAAMAGATDIRLGGPRIYAGETVSQAYLNAAGRPVKGAADIMIALILFDFACWSLWALVVLLLAVSLVAAA